MTVLDIRFSDWIRQGVQLFVDHSVLLLLSGLVAALISTVTLGILAGPMLAGMALIILRLQDNRLAPPSVNDLFKGFDYFVETIPVTLALYAMGVLAMLLNWIPLAGQILNSVIVSVVSCTAILTVFSLVDRRLSPRTSWRPWWGIFMMNWGPLLGFYILATIIGVIGVMVFFIGLAATLPLQLCILASAYRSICRQSAAL